MNRLLRDARAWAETNRSKLPYIGGALVLLIIYLVSSSSSKTTYVYRNEKNVEFKDGKVFGSRSDSIYEGKERLLSKVVKDLQDSQSQVKDTQGKLLARLDELEKARASGTPGTSDPSANPSGTPGADGHLFGPPEPTPDKPVTLSPPASNLAVGRVDQLRSSQGAPMQLEAPSSYAVRDRGSKGPTTISFPVKDNPVDRSEAIAIPAGSYVKAKLMTGIEAPEGKTYPVLLQLDFAYIAPNKHRIDLSGCFMIAKSTGNLSTERVEMQPTKLSCVSRDGKMFEREVSGFIADDKDNSFAVIGSVNTKQDRVAAMAFLSSIVEGVGKTLQQAQTTQQTTPLGGSQSVLTGDQGTYIAAGGAANAASMVTQWYLKQAQNLLPTINIGSGQDVWVVMQETVKLPNDYFRKASQGEMNASVYTYFSRVNDTTRP